MFVILLLKFASSTKAYWVQVGLTGLHGVQSGQHSVQLLDVMCTLVGVLAVAVKGENCAPVMDMSQG